MKEEVSAIQRDLDGVSRDTKMLRGDTKIIRDDTASLRTQFHGLQAVLNASHQHNDTMTRNKVLNWISPTDYPAEHSEILRRRQDATGRWFLRAPEVQRWLNEPREHLFCHGIPGAGKSMIAAIAIEFLQNKVQNDAIGVVFVFFHYKIQEDYDVATFLGAVLKQLIQAQRSIPDHIARLYEEHTAKGTNLCSDEIMNALQSVASTLSRLYVVVDALDECPGGGICRRFMSYLHALRSLTDIRLMTTSLISSDAEDFHGALKLDVQATPGDIKRYVAGQIDELPKCIRRNVSLQYEVQEKISTAAGGMYVMRSSKAARRY